MVDAVAISDDDGGGDGNAQRIVSLVSWSAVVVCDVVVNWLADYQRSTS